MGTRREDFPVYEHYGENYTDLLPQEFTRDDVRALRIAHGMKPDPNNAIKQWLHRGQIEKDDVRGLYVKKVTVTGYN